VQSIKSGTPHEQCPARHPVPSIDDDVRGLAGIAPWSQKNSTPRLTLQSSQVSLATNDIYIYIYAFRVRHSDFNFYLIN
jgi:hypothetical protein